MAKVYSTNSVPPGERASYWGEVASKEFSRMAFESGVGPTYSAELRTDVVGGLQISRSACDPCHVAREAHDIARDKVDNIGLVIGLSGISVAEQDGRTSRHATGSMFLLDGGRPNSVHFQSRADLLILRFARGRLLRRLENAVDLTARPIPIDGPVSGLTTRFLTLLSERTTTLGKAAGQKLSEQALDLVALAFTSELLTATDVSPSARAVARMRLKSVIEARLYEPQLKPAVVATDAGMSVRYANALLSEEGSSVERFILSRRLERCRQALEDTAQVHRTIGEIAFAWGFSDLSHFVRRFRAAYGVTPGGFRKRAQAHATG